MTDQKQESRGGFAVLSAMRGVSAALAKMGIEKGSKNKDQGFWYRGIDDLMQAIAPLLVQHELLILPSYQGWRCESRITRKGGSIYDVVVQGTFRFTSVADGSVVEIVTYGEGMDSADKATTKAMAIAFKYALMQGFHIPLEGTEDPDSDAHDETTPAGRVTRQDVEDVVKEIELRFLEAGDLPELSALFAQAQADVRRNAKEAEWPREYLAEALGEITGAKDKAKDRIRKRKQGMTDDEPPGGAPADDDSEPERGESRGRSASGRERR